MKEFVLKIFNALLWKRRFRRNCKYYLKERKHYKLDKLSKAQKKETKQYWKQFNMKADLRYTRFYTSITKTFTPKWIPDHFYYTRIALKLSFINKGLYFDDKSLYKLYYPSVKQPETLVMKINGCILDKNYQIVDLDKLEIGDKSYICKPCTNTYGGHGISFFTNKEIDKLKKYIKETNNVIVQEVVKQNASLAYFHPKSLNTIRVVSFLWNNEVRILSSIYRFGTDDMLVDNYSSGGYIVTIDQNGFLEEFAYGKNQRRISEVAGKGKLLGHKIEGFEKVIETVKKQAQMFPDFRYIGWDFTIDDDLNPILIEANYNGCDIELVQISMKGPAFGDLTDEILAYTFK